jgi:uncharacterized protein
MNSHVALITGASSGLGATFARQLAGRGCQLILVARRREKLDALAAEITAQYGVTPEVLPADLTDESQLAAVEQRIRKLPEIEYLINNAGFGVLGRFTETPVEPHDRMHRLHVLATMRLTHAALAVMLAHRCGNIINVSSVAGFWVTPGSVSYSATKAWVNSFTEGLYLDLRAIGSPVRVQALCPGFTLTEFHDIAGIDRGTIPKSWWMKADFVVQESLRGLERGKLFVIPARKYRILVAAHRLLPRSWRHWAALWVRRRPRPPQG